MKPLCLSLCDYSGRWSHPWRETHDVACLDIKRGEDIRLIETFDRYDRKADVILAAPTCTKFAGSGARHWKSYTDEMLIEALALVDSCLRWDWVHKPRVFALENAVGRLRRWIGPATWTFNPYEFAGWADDPDSEAYTKRTCLWGRFALPEKRPVPPVLGSKTLKFGGPSERTKTLRSITPDGFARAFYEANKGDISR